MNRILSAFRALAVMLVLMTLVLWVSPAGAQTFPSPQTSEAQPRVDTVYLVQHDTLKIPRLPSGYLALTYCDKSGKGESIFRSTIFTDPTDAFLAVDVMAHEATHREQFNREGMTCAEYSAAYEKDVHFRVTSEAEAYCKGILATKPMENPDNWTLRRNQVLAIQWQIFSQQGISYAEILDQFNSYGCESIQTNLAPGLP